MNTETMTDDESLRIQSSELQTQGVLRRGLFQVDNQDALRALLWLLCNCEFSKKAWIEIEMRHELYSSPN